MKRLAMLAFVAAAPFLAGCYHRHVYVHHNADPVHVHAGHNHGPNCGHDFVNGCWVAPRVTVVHRVPGPHVVIAPLLPHFFGWRGPRIVRHDHCR
jgi:hypothetical protein